MNLKDIPLGWAIGIYVVAAIGLIICFIGIGSLIR